VNNYTEEQAKERLRMLPVELVRVGGRDEEIER
jgi:hypothetical protein